MPRKSRNLQIQDGDSFHTMWQCHNKSFLFESEFIKGRYYELLLKYATKFGVKIHAYCFMSSHPHLYGTLSSVPDFIKFQHVVNLGLAKEIKKNVFKWFMNRVWGFCFCFTLNGSNPRRCLTRGSKGAEMNTLSSPNTFPLEKCYILNPNNPYEKNPKSDPGHKG